MPLLYVSTSTKSSIIREVYTKMYKYKKFCSVYMRIIKYNIVN